MWLSERIARSGSEQAKTASIAEITIGGESAAAYSDAESRNLTVVSAGGVIWRPVAGQKVLVVACGDGEHVVAGAVQGAPPSGMANGEVYITTNGGASVYLKNNGDVIISGNVNVNGTLKVNGSTVAVTV